MKRSTFMLTILLAMFSGLATATAGINHGPSGHAPIGVMADHTHKKNEFMFSYRFMRMMMDDNRSGTNTVSTNDVLDDFAVSPLKMTMDMHMFGGMFAFSERFTAMIMVPYIELSMDHITGPLAPMSGVQFTTESSGIGDINFSGLFKLSESSEHSGHLTIGLSVPTGSIDERDNNPRCTMMGSCPSRLPYPMQTSSGTYDLNASLTHRQRMGKWAVGSQTGAKIRLGDNNQGYTLGNEYWLTGWAQYDLSKNIAGSLRLAYKHWENIDGSDDELRNLPGQFIPTARTDLRAGKRLDLGAGINTTLGDCGLRLAIEYLVPVYQELDGPQLEVLHTFTIGLQYSM